jgi:hypothetical protein
VDSLAELYVTRTADEDGNASSEFKDKQERVVLIRKVLYAGGTKATCDTYYVYAVTTAVVVRPFFR